VGWASSSGIAGGSFEAFSSREPEAIISGTHFNDFHFPRHFFKKELEREIGWKLSSASDCYFSSFFACYRKHFANN